MRSRLSLLVFGICGAVGLLVDIDHVLSQVVREQWGVPTTHGRIWHTVLFVATGAIVCGLGSRATGLHRKLVLSLGVGIVTMAVLLGSPLVKWGI